MDEQELLDLQTKAARYERIVRAHARVEDAAEQVRLLRAKLKQAEGELREARWDLTLAESPLKRGVRG